MILPKSTTGYKHWPARMRRGMLPAVLKLLCIAIGGAAGALLRYGVSSWVQNASASTFPWGTLVVNLAGSLAIGVLWALTDLREVPPNVRMLIMVGLLGAFTTFSTFSMESLGLLQSQRFLAAGLNVLGSCTAGIMLVFAGYASVRWLLAAMR